MSKKVLYVGDVHATQTELADCKKLVDLVQKVATLHKVDRITFLGDQYHTHAIMRIEVMAFWQEAFSRLSKEREVVVLVGNHDKPNDASERTHALLAHPNVTVVDRPTVLDGVLHLPYCHTAEEFVEACSGDGRENLKVVVCHQSFNGGKYENGIYMEGGVDPELVPQKYVISGHVHSPQRFSKVWYVGAPRWRSLSDASAEARHINVVEHNEEGYKVVAQFDTGKVCKRIVYATVTPESPEVPAISEKDVVYVDVRGPEDFVNSKAIELKSGGIRVRKFPYARKTIRVKESEGISKSFSKFVLLFKTPNGTPSEVVSECLNERIGA